jgi:hypothetical protein
MAMVNMVSMVLVLLCLSLFIISVSSFVPNMVSMKRTISASADDVIDQSARRRDIRREQLKTEVLKVIAGSDRGQSKDAFLIDKIDSIIKELEGLNPTSNLFESSSKFTGDWNLLYATDDLTRSSPFFWAFSKALRGIDDPIRSRAFSDSIYSISDMDFMGLKSVGECMQKIDSNQLVSQVRLNIKPVGSSLMTTTSFWQPVQSDVVQLTVQKTQVLDSTIGSLLPSFLDPNKLLSFPSGTALEAVKPDSSVVYMRVSYLDDTMRVCVNDDDMKTFVYYKTK